MNWSEDSEPPSTPTSHTLLTQYHSCLVIKMNVAGTPVIGVPNHTRSFIRSSGVARRYPGIRHTPISDILAVTTTGRYRDVCVEAVWSRGHLG